MPGFDNTPRSGAGGVVLHGAEPFMFESQVARAVAHVTAEQPVADVSSSSSHGTSGPRATTWSRTDGTVAAFLEALAKGIAEGSAQ